MNKPMSPVRMLVVEPDEPARTILRRRFTRLGYEVMEAADAGKALSLASMIPFDLALLDMGARDHEGAAGFELLERLRETRGAAELPILAVVDDAVGEDAVEALHLGANDCLARPLDPEAALARAEMLLQRREKVAPAGREMQVRIAALQEATERAEQVSPIFEGLGHEVRAPLNGLIGASAVITRICQTPALKTAIAAVEDATAALDLMMVRALGRNDRRMREAKTKLRVLVADDEPASRLAVRDLLHASEVAIELTEAGSGLQAALTAEGVFFDLIVMNLATPEAAAGIRAIRRTERQNKTRRTPILAIGPGGLAATSAMEAGADLHMTAPVNAERLLSALAAAMSRECVDLSETG